MVVKRNAKVAELGGISSIHAFEEDKRIGLWILIKRYDAADANLLVAGSRMTLWE